MSDYLNSNGLVRGKIPAGQPCPFEGRCSRKCDTCPVTGSTKTNEFSCALARLHSLLAEGQK